MITMNNAIDLRIIENLLEQYQFTAKELVDENDGSIILWSNEFDTWASGKDKEDAIKQLAAELLDFSKDFYNDFDIWAKGRESLIPYVLKILILNDVDKIGELIICRHGEN